jgi:hypothetical protein
MEPPLVREFERFTASEASSFSRICQTSGVPRQCRGFTYGKLNTYRQLFNNAKIKGGFSMDTIKRFHRIIFLSFLVFLLILTANAIAFDGDKLWDEYGIDVYNGADILLSDKNGGAIFVSRHPSDYPYAIRAQRYDYDGNPLWGTATLVSGSMETNSVAATEDGSGGIVVTWRSGADIYAQRLNSNGEKQWNSGSGVLVLAGIGMPNDWQTPVICYDGVGGAHVAYKWQANKISASGYVADTTGYQVVPSNYGYTMIADGAYSTFPIIPGGVFIAWYNSSDQNIYAQHITFFTGTPNAQWGTEGALVSTRYTGSPSLLRDGVGGVIIAWSGWEPSSDKGQMRAQRLNSSGSPLWGTDGVVVLDSNSAGIDITEWGPSDLRMVTDGAQGAILAWTDKRNLTDEDTDIRCQRVASSGSMLWKSDGVWINPGGSAIIPTSGTDKNPALISDRAGGAIIAATNQYITENIYANRIDSEGSIVWSKYIIYDDWEYDPRDQNLAQIVFDNSGPSPRGAIFSWEATGWEDAQKVEINQLPPENDDMADAIILYEDMGGRLGSLSWATNDGSATCGSSASNPDVWYKFQAPALGTLKVSTCGTHDYFGVDTGVDTVLSLHAASDGSQITGMCNDDWPQGTYPSACLDGSDLGVPRDSAISYEISNGETVLIRVSSWGSKRGFFSFHFEFEPDPCQPSPEVCDGTDNDCDGLIDEGLGTTPTSCGQGECADTGVLACVEGEWKDSCVPGQPSPEVCDGLDNDCDGSTDEGLGTTPTSCGQGECADTGVLACLGGGWIDSCVPGQPSPEVCDGLDNDCDGQTDEGVGYTYYRDFDGDTYGDPTVSTQTCSDTPPEGYVTNNTDCDDNDLLTWECNAPVGDNVEVQDDTGKVTITFPHVEHQGNVDISAGDCPPPEELEGITIPPLTPICVYVETSENFLFPDGGKICIEYPDTGDNAFEATLVMVRYEEPGAKGVPLVCEPPIPVNTEDNIICGCTDQFSLFAYGVLTDSDNDGIPDLSDNCPDAWDPSNLCDGCLSDTDLDQDVDGLDLATMINAFGTSSGDPNYNFSADLNEDGVVDEIDLVLTAMGFGRTDCNDNP